MANPIFATEGFADTLSALSYVMLSAPNFRHGLTLDDVAAGLEQGYASVRPKIKDEERIAEFELSLSKMRAAIGALRNNDIRTGVRTIQEASEIFRALRRIKGRRLSIQEQYDTYDRNNEVDE